MQFADIRKEGKLARMILDTGKASSMHLIALAEAAAKEKKPEVDLDFEELAFESDFTLNKVEM